MKAQWLLLWAAMAAGCGDDSHSSTPDASPMADAAMPDGSMAAAPAQVSRALALTNDGASLWVVNPDSDSVSVIDTAQRSLRHEILLGMQPPAVDPTSHRYDPAVMPRALALDEPKGKLYVAGEMSSTVYVVDLAGMTVTTTIPVGAEPTAVVASHDGATVYVVSHQSASITRIDAATNTVSGTLSVGAFPWGASISADGGTLYVTHFLTDPAVTLVDTATFTVRSVTPMDPQPVDSGGNKLIPNGTVRGAYAVVPRPGTNELWVPHLLLAVGTPQPSLDFQSTVFPTVSRFSPEGAATSRILFKPPTVAGASGNFTDSCSGPRDVAFTPDGGLALVALGASEDVMVFDGTSGNEVDLVRPVPSTMLEGIVVDPSGTRAYVLGRNTHDVTVLSITPQGTRKAQVDGTPINTLAAADPMPAQLRLGQRLFYTANSAAYPVTQNFWVACSSCHLEGRSDAVTWLFAQGPRDTPSNAGGPINTGFLFRQAVRNDVIDYDQTIRVEQGGSYDRTNASQLPDLQALAAYVNYAIGFPPNPNLAPGGLTASQMAGQVVFGANCASCHSGPFFTDSGMGNPTLDLSGTVVLHDIGTCVTTGAHPDVPAMDIDGHARTACDFDTPTLRGIFASPPYFHDGSAATLADVVDRIPGASGLTAQQKSDLVAYLLTL